MNDTASWLTVAAGSVDGNGLGDYRLSVDRGGLGDAVYPATVEIDWRDTDSGDNQTLELAVSMQVGQTVAGDTGYLYVLLVDADTGRTVRELRLEADGGRYQYRFEGVAAGRYYLVAGGDADHDGYICDRGEACGAWPDAGRAQVISVSADRGGLDFASSFEATLGTAAPRGGDRGYRRLERE